MSSPHLATPPSPTHPSLRSRGQQVTTWRKYRLSKGAMSRPPNPGAQGLGLHPASLAAAEPSPAACGLPDPAPPPLRLRAAARLPAGLHSLQPPAPDFSRRHHPPHPPRGLPGRGRSQGAPPRTASQSRVGKGIVVRRHLRAGRQVSAGTGRDRGRDRCPSTLAAGAPRGGFPSQARPGVACPWSPAPHHAFPRFCPFKSRVTRTHV